MEVFQRMLRSIGPGLLSFAQDLVRCKSVTGQEGEVIQRIQQEMTALHYNNILTDSLGSVAGVIGHGPKHIYFDGHVDTVGANPAEWSFDPWSGEIRDGQLLGRGSVDMKGSVAAAVYGAALARDHGFTKECTIYVSCSVMEEDFEGVALESEFKELKLIADAAVICEPTNLRICNGHFGRALFEVTVPGVSVHASRHQRGVNALEQIIPAIQRTTSRGRMLLEADGARGSIAATKLETEAASINSIPSRAVLTIDRRTCYDDTEERLRQEMDEICGDIPGAEWKVAENSGNSWRGKYVTQYNLLPAWRIPQDHRLVLAAQEACRDLGLRGEVYRRNGFTNGFYTCAKKGVPTIVLGAGDEALCHVADERCSTDQITKAAMLYALLISKL